MIDGTDVGFVDTHAESDRCDDRIEGTAHEGLLCIGTGLIGEACMVCAGGNAFTGEEGCNFFGGLLEGDVDDGGFIRVFLEAVEEESLPLGVRAWCDGEVEVGAIKGRLDKI